jgi:hypothetical protein
LDGAVMANALHFHKDKLAVVRLIKGYLAGGRFRWSNTLSTGHVWVPHPLSYPTGEAGAGGFTCTRILATRPVDLGEISRLESI